MAVYKRMEDEEEKEAELRDYIETGKIIKSGALSAELKTPFGRTPQAYTSVSTSHLTGPFSIDFQTT